MDLSPVLTGWRVGLIDLSFAAIIKLSAISNRLASQTKTAATNSQGPHYHAPSIVPIAMHGATASFKPSSVQSAAYPQHSHEPRAGYMLSLCCAPLCTAVSTYRANSAFARYATKTGRANKSIKHIGRSDHAGHHLGNVYFITPRNMRLLRFVFFCLLCIVARLMVSQ